MIHKPGKGWSKRGDFRPITLKGEKDIEGLMQRLRMDGGTDDAG